MSLEFMEDKTQEALKRLNVENTLNLDDEEEMDDLERDMALIKDDGPTKMVESKEIIPTSDLLVDYRSNLVRMGKFAEPYVSLLDELTEKIDEVRVEESQLNNLSEFNRQRVIAKINERRESAVEYVKKQIQNDVLNLSKEMTYDADKPLEAQPEANPRLKEFYDREILKVIADGERNIQLAKDEKRVELNEELEAGFKDWLELVNNDPKKVYLSYFTGRQEIVQNVEHGKQAYLDYQFNLVNVQAAKDGSRLSESLDLNLKSSKDSVSELLTMLKNLNDFKNLEALAADGSMTFDVATGVIGKKIQEEHIVSTPDAMLNSVIEVTPMGDGFATLNSYGFFESPDLLQMVIFMVSLRGRMKARVMLMALNKRVYAQLTPIAFDELQMIADSEHLSVSGLVRKVLLDYMSAYKEPFLTSKEKKKQKGVNHGSK